MTKVKICGLCLSRDIAAVNAEKPDYIGFVFAKSKRKLTPLQAIELKKLLLPDIISVGVFVDSPIQDILALSAEGVIDAIQLHGSEEEEYIKKLKKLTGKTIIKAISVQNKGDVQKWGKTSADYLLLDHRGGGTGQKFDWDLIGKSDKPYFLAGGLNSENIRDAIQKNKPYAVDISSGVEIENMKDPVKIREFIRRARNEN